MRQSVNQRRSLAILVVVCAAAFFGVLNASAVVVVLPQLGTTYSAGPEALGWVMSLFLLTYGIAIPFYGRLSERFGARRLYLFGMGLFGVGSLLCAVAPNLSLMLVARVVQGLGGAAFPGLGMTLASRAFPPERRGVALGSIAATMGVGSAVGPLAGGLIADIVSWRLLFGISGMAVLIIPFARRILPAEERAGGGSLDLPGGTLLALVISGALFSLAEGSRSGWTSLSVLTIGAVTVIAAVAVTIHHRRARSPFVARELVANPVYRRIVAMGFLTTGTNLAALIGLPMLLTPVHGLSPFEVGLVMLPGAAATAISGVVAGRLVDRHGPRLPTLVGAVTMVGVMIGLSFVAGRSILAVALLAGALGAAYSLVNTPLAAAITNLVRPGVLASALSINIMVFFVGGSFGTTAFVALSEASQAAPWNPLYAGQAFGFANAFMLFAVPMAVTAVLAAGLPASRRTPA